RFALLFTLVVSTIYAQTEVARIIGTVTDPSGAVIPAATITVRNEINGQVRQLSSNEQGSYVATQLLPAVYTVKVESTGMADCQVTGVRLQVGQERTLNFTLQPAAVTTELKVSGGEMTVIDYSSARVGANVSTREVAELPMNGRQVSQLYLMAPG